MYGFGRAAVSSQPSVPQELLLSALREALRRWHPDKAANGSADARFWAQKPRTLFVVEGSYDVMYDDIFMRGPGMMFTAV